MKGMIELITKGPTFFIPLLINILEGCTFIGSQAFSNCIYITSITIPSTMTSIRDNAFSCCGITSITIPSGVTSIEVGAFFSCANLASIIIPDGVTSIQQNAFYYCPALKTVYYGGQNSTSWNSINIANYNNYVKNATKYYRETKPSSGYYWHYVNGVPTKW